MSMRGRAACKATGNRKKADKGKKDDENDKFEIREELEMTCGTCEVGIQDEIDSSIQCDGPCQKWHHLECERLTEDEAEILSGGKRNVKWFCNVCIGTVTEFITDERESDYVEMRKKHRDLTEKMKTLEQSLQALTETIKKDTKDLKEKIKILEKEPTTEELGIDEMKKRLGKLEKSEKEKCNSTDVKGIVDFEIKKVQRNAGTTMRNENRNRENNILIYRAVEEDNEGQNERDKELVKKLFKTCKVVIKDAQIKNIVRLGKKIEGKTRPILVQMKDKDDKSSLFKGIAELRNGPEELKTLSIGNDLSPEERKEMKKLVEEAKQKELEDPENKYRVRGPPWNMEIRKIRI